MGLTKQYLRYLSLSQLGIVASSSCNCVFLTLRGSKTRYVATAACEHVNIWDLRTSNKIVVLQGDKYEVTYIAKSPDNFHIAVGYTDGSVKIFHLLTSEEVVTFNGHRSAITCLTYDKEGMRLASGSKDTEIVVWDLVNESGLYRLKGHKGVITSCVFLKSKNMLLTSSKDTFVKWWDLDTQHCFKTMVGHRGEVWSICVTCDDKYLISGSCDSELRMWSIAFDATIEENSNAKTRKLSNGESSGASSDSETENDEVSDRLVVCAKMGSVMRHSTDRVVSMTLDKSGQLLTCHGNKRDVEVFKIRNDNDLNLHMKKKLKRIRKRQKNDNDNKSPSISTTAEDILYNIGCFKCSSKVRFSDIAFEGNTNEYKILSLTISNQLEIYKGNLSSGNLDKTEKPSLQLSLHGHRAEPRTIAFSRDGSAILTASADCAKLWNRSSQQCIRTLSCGHATCCAFVPGDRQVFIGTKNGNIEIHDIASGNLLESLDCSDSQLTSVELYPDLCGVATSGGNTVKFWEFGLITDENFSKSERRLTLKLKRKLQLDDEVTCLKFSENRKFISVALADCSVKVFFVDTLKFFLSLYGHSLPVTSMSMSTDSTLIVTGSSDRNMKIWGLDFGDCHKSIFAHDDTITCVQFIPDTHMVFTCGKDGSIKQWDADKFLLIQSLLGHQGTVWSLNISSDGDYVASCGSDKSVRLWSKSEEILIPEEERELEREEEDEKRLAKSQEAVIPGEAEPEETGMASKVTISTIKGSEKIMEAIEIYREETVKIAEYEAAIKSSKKELPPRTVHPILQAYGNITPEKHVLQVIEKVKRSDLDESLLVLPFSYVPDILKLLNGFIQKSWNVELCCRCIFFLLRVHHGQIISNQMMVSLLSNLQKNTEQQVSKLKDVMGFNIAALNHIKRELESKHEVKFFTDATERFEEKTKHRKKKTSAALLSI